MNSLLLKVCNIKGQHLMLAFLLKLSGGDEEDRTLDLTDANRTLSQLSYVPTMLFILLLSAQNFKCVI